MVEGKKESRDFPLSNICTPGSNGVMGVMACLRTIRISCLSCLGLQLTMITGFQCADPETTLRSLNGDLTVFGS